MGKKGEKREEILPSKLFKIEKKGVEKTPFPYLKISKSGKNRERKE
jgi:hypothetical protein